MLQLHKRRFDFYRFLQVLALTLVACAVVTGVTAYQFAALELSSVVWQSLLIALPVAACAGWLFSRMGARAPGGAWDDTVELEAGPEGPDTAEMINTYRIADSLEAQGITIKLLELIALGDRYGNVFSVAMIGVDHLDEIRRRYDAGVTERLLQQVSSALAHTLRMPDRVGDFGRGKYLVVLPETKLPGAIQIAERLRGAVSRLDIPAPRRVNIQTTASVGVTSFRRGDDMQSLLERAGKALRGAQNQGRNRVLPDLAA